MDERHIGVPILILHVVVATGDVCVTTLPHGVPELSAEPTQPRQRMALTLAARRHKTKCRDRQEEA